MTAPPTTGPISFFAERSLRRLERRYDYNFDYVRYLWHISRPAFRRFTFGFGWFANGRKNLPADAGAIAGIVSTLHADCGPCTQITVNMALEAGVDPTVLSMAIAGDIEALPNDLALVYRFTKAIVNGDFQASVLRDQIVTRYGEKGLIDLSTIISVGQVYPVLKRTLGFGETCLRVQVGPQTVDARRADAKAA
ncbi:hypothetical protein [Pyruvatibacter sp.]|uniref:hypothetical protein n=1 Tax=Pyruvatibacter sp. TaxID=1981328 RepID=UPI0032EF8BA2